LKKRLAKFKYFSCPALLAENCNPKFAWCITCVW